MAIMFNFGDRIADPPVVLGLLKSIGPVLGVKAVPSTYGEIIIETCYENKEDYHRTLTEGLKYNGDTIVAQAAVSKHSNLVQDRLANLSWIPIEKVTEVLKENMSRYGRVTSIGIYRELSIPGQETQLS
jgi:hypothetical protein